MIHCPYCGTWNIKIFMTISGGVRICLCMGCWNYFASGGDI